MMKGGEPAGHGDGSAHPAAAGDAAQSAQRARRMDDAAAEQAGGPLSGQPPSGQPPSGQPLSGQSLSGQSLSGQSLSGQSLSGQSLSGQAKRGAGKVAISREFLRRLPILGLLTDEQLTGAMAVSRLTQYAKKAPVVLKGQAVDHLAILVSGKLQVVDYMADGREIGLNIIQAGGFFGELSVIDRLPRSATLVALTPSVVIHIPGDFARRLFFEYPPLAEAMLVHLARSLRRMTDLRAVQALPHSFQRVYALLDYVKEQAPGGMWLINDLPTHQEIAIMVNTSRETVTRALSSLTAAGIVEKDLRRLLIRKPEVLARLAEEGPRLSIERRGDARGG